MRHELWDYKSGNLQGMFPSLKDALAAVRESVERNGRDTLDGLILFRIEAVDQRELVARDYDLVPLITTPAGAH